MHKVSNYFNPIINSNIRNIIVDRDKSLCSNLHTSMRDYANLIQTSQIIASDSYLENVEKSGMNCLANMNYCHEYMTAPSKLTSYQSSCLCYAEKGIAGNGTACDYTAIDQIMEIKNDIFGGVA